MNDQSDSTGRREAYIGRMRDMARGALAEAKAWEAFKWVVVALLIANFLLIAGLYRGVASDIAELKKDRGSETNDLSAARASFAKDMSEMQAALTKDIADAKTGLTQAISDLRNSVNEETAKINAKLETPTGSTPQPQQKSRQRR
jgi:hypothetical protein